MEKGKGKWKVTKVTTNNEQSTSTADTFEIRQNKLFLELKPLNKKRLAIS